MSVVSRIAVILMAIVAAMLSLLAPAALAKGPVDLVISGPTLEHPVRIPARDLDSFNVTTFSTVGASAPSSLPAISYRIDFYEPGSQSSFFAYLYYPAHDGQPAMTRQLNCERGCWGKVSAGFERLVTSSAQGPPISRGLPSVIAVAILSAFLVAVFALLVRSTRSEVLTAAIADQT